MAIGLIGLFCASSICAETCAASREVERVRTVLKCMMESSWVVWR